MMENPNLKWMMTGGSPILGNLQQFATKLDDLGDTTILGNFNYWYN